MAKYSRSFTTSPLPGTVGLAARARWLLQEATHQLRMLVNGALTWGKGMMTVLIKPVVIVWNDIFSFAIWRRDLYKWEYLSEIASLDRYNCSIEIFVVFWVYNVYMEHKNSWIFLEDWIESGRIFLEDVFLPFCCARSMPFPRHSGGSSCKGMGQIMSDCWWKRLAWHSQMSKCQC